MCEDLRPVPESSDSYELLQATKHLRQLLLDGMMDDVNRDARFKIRFETKSREELRKLGGPGVMFGMANNLLPEGTEPSKRESLKLEHFLAAPVLCFAEKLYTVRDVIDHGANSFGGVHHKTPQGDQQWAVEALSSRMSLGGIPASLMQMRSITAVTLTALQPLINYAEEQVRRTEPWY
jgi:hypothetical protein